MVNENNFDFDNINESDSNNNELEQLVEKVIDKDKKKKSWVEYDSCRKCACVIEEDKGEEKFVYGNKYDNGGNVIGTFYICKSCHDLGLHEENEKNTEKETREYKITAYKEQLDSIECLLKHIQNCGRIGHSESIKIYVDGDGAFRIEVERTDGKELSNHLNGYAMYTKTPKDTYGTYESTSIDLG